MVLDARNWKQRVNQVETDSELQAMRCSVNRGAPYGIDRWVKLTAKRIGRGFTIRPRGRVRKHPKSRMSPGMGQINKSTKQRIGRSSNDTSCHMRLKTGRVRGVTEGDLPSANRSATTDTRKNYVQRCRHRTKYGTGACGTLQRVGYRRSCLTISF